MPVEGILLLDKPKGLTSHDVVNRVRRVFGMKAVGHSGTLDPLASGLMVMLLGQGTRLSPFFLEGDKAYDVTLKLGVETDTWDLDGKTLNENPIPDLSEEDVLEVLRKMSGKLELQVPPYSAVKVNGKKLYEYARQGLDVPVVRREMNFKKVEFQSLTSDAWKVGVAVSKGTFIRSWVHEIGKKLGCGAAVSDLRRVYSEPYEISGATTLDDLESANLSEGIPGFLPMEETLPQWPQVVVRGRWQKLVENGAIPDGMRWQLESLLENLPEGAKGIRIRNADTGRLMSLLIPHSGGAKLKLACVFK